MKQLILLLIFFPLFIYGQKTDDLLGLRIGYSSANINFKEAFAPSINFFGQTFNTGNIYVGDGVELGISKDLNKGMFLDLSVSLFSGKDSKAKVNNNENYYILHGFQIPVTLNYLLRNNTKKLRINLGAGLQFLNAHLKQYEMINDNNGRATTQTKDIKISELQLALRPGIQFRIIQNLYACFIVRMGISINGRYDDNPCLSIKYIFKTKR